MTTKAETTFAHETESFAMIRNLALVFTLAVTSVHAADAPKPEVATSPSKIRITEEAIGLAQGPRSTLVAEVVGDTTEARAFIEKLWTEHHASFPADQRVHYGPDSGFTQIEIVRGRERIVVGSWHTIEKTSPKLFASHSGLGVLGRRTREQALAAEPAAYRRFRESFDAIVTAVTAKKKP